MRSLLMLATLAGFIWLICRFFYSLGKMGAIKGQSRTEEASRTRRKKVESFVIEKDNHGSRGDNKQ